MTSLDEYDAWYFAGVDPGAGIGELFEQIIECLYGEVLKPGDFALDGGANRGRHTLPMSDTVGPNGLIAAVEALPQLAADLGNRVARDDRRNVTVIGKALGSSEGEYSSFVFVRADDGYSGRLRREGIPENAIRALSNITVPMTTIDLIALECKRGDLRFIKLDLEGGEYDALRGARRVLRQSSPIIVFENGRGSSAAVYGYSEKEWFNLFQEGGYKVFDLFGLVLWTRAVVLRTDTLLFHRRDTSIRYSVFRNSASWRDTIFVWPSCAKDLGSMKLGLRPSFSEWALRLRVDHGSILNKIDLICGRSTMERLRPVFPSNMVGSDARSISRQRTAFRHINSD